MKKIYTRKVTPIEYLMVSANEISPPFANQIFFEGMGNLDINKLRIAVEAASEANPGMRLVLKGSLLFSRWIDSGQTPRVREVDGSTWSGFSSEGAPFLQEGLSPYTGPSCEVVLIQGNPLRVLFRSLHAVSDAGGTITWISDIFRSLRGEPLMGSNSTITEEELAWKFQKEYSKDTQDKYIPLTGKTISNELGFIWGRRQIKGRYRDLMATIAVMLAKEALSHGEGAIRVNIPVDMRFREAGLCSTAHLSRSIKVDIEHDADVEQVAKSIKQLIADKQEGMHSRMLNKYIIMMFPQWLSQKYLKQGVNKKYKSGFFPISWAMTSVRFNNLEDFSEEEFTTSNAWGIPPCPSIWPGFLAFSIMPGDIVNIMLSVPRSFASLNDIDGILDRLVSGLT